MDEQLNPESEEEIDVHSPDNLALWSEKLGIDEKALADLIGKVGPKVLELRRVLGKYTPAGNPR